MGCIIWRAKLRGPPAREALGLIAASEEGELCWIGVARFGKPQRCRAQRLFPFNLAEFAGAPFTHADQRFR